MNSFNFELSKILKRKFPLGLLIASTILFPSLVKITSYLNIIKDKVQEDFFIGNVSFGIIAYSQTYFFLPVWIILLIGYELANGHVNRVVFIRSRNFYFSSKLIFCFVVATYFSLLGLLTLFISIKTSPFPNLEDSLLFYFQFFFQMLLSSFSFSILLMCLVFLIGSPLKTFVIYFGWSFIEGTMFLFVDAKYNIQLKWLPLHLVRTLYASNGEAQVANYHNPIVDNFLLILMPIGFILSITLLTYYHFSKSNLPHLSD